MTPSTNESAWHYQWSAFEDQSEMLFHEWIWPNRMEDFAGKTVLDAGCGRGQHLKFVASYAKQAVGVDLNCAALAAQHCADCPNVSTIEDDLIQMDLGRTFQVAYSIGVLHHTDDPRAAFQNVARHVEIGGRVIVWVYGHEGNALNRLLVEPVKRYVLRYWPRAALVALAHILTVLLYVPVYTAYRLPLRFLPYYHYFQNFRRLGYRRNVLNVFDKLNAPQTWFIRRREVADWFSDGFEDVSLESYLGVSWRASGTRSEPHT